jgi:hypothetical protein
MHALVDAFAFAAALGDVLARGGDLLAALVNDVAWDLAISVVAGWLGRRIDGR